MKSAVSPHSNHVFSVLSYLLQGGEKLTLLIPFKGLLIAQEVRSLHIGQDHIVLQAPTHHICSNIHDHVYLYTVQSPQGMIANVQNLNLQRGIITLTGFKFMDSPWHDRKSERVEPVEPLHITLSTKNATFRGRLENLSMNGLGMLLYTKNFKNIPIKAGESVNTRIILGEDIPPLEMRGKLVASRLIGQALTHLGMEIRPEGLQKTLLTQYISTRRHEILAELEHLSNHVLEPKYSKDLYY